MLAVKSRSLIAGKEIFGSFVTSDEGYYPLTRKYRRMLRKIARMIPLDIIRVRPNLEQGPFSWKTMTYEKLPKETHETMTIGQTVH